MKLADALGNVDPQPAGTEAPKRPGPQAVKNPGTQGLRSLGAQAPKLPELPLQGAAKSTHPDFAAVKVYVRKSTRRDSEYKYQAGGGKDFSDLVEELLQKYLGT